MIIKIYVMNFVGLKDISKPRSGGLN